MVAELGRFVGRESSPLEAATKLLQSAAFDFQLFGTGDDRRKDLKTHLSISIVRRSSAERTIYIHASICQKNQINSKVK